MKLTRTILGLIKICFVAYLMLTSEINASKTSLVRTKSARSAASSSLKSFSTSMNKFQTRIIDVTFKELAEFVAGAIVGFIQTKKEFIEWYISIAADTYKFIIPILSECKPEAEKAMNTVDPSDAAMAEDLDIFMSVIEETQREAELDKFITACREKDNAKITEYTAGQKKQVEALIEYLKNNKVTKIKKFKNRRKKKNKNNQSSEPEHDAEKLNKIKNYFDYSDKGMFSKVFASTRTVCDYVYKDNQNSYFKKFFNFSSAIIKCGGTKIFEKLRQPGTNPPAEKTPVDYAQIADVIGKVFDLVKGAPIVQTGKLFYHLFKNLYFSEKTYYDVGHECGVDLAYIYGKYGIRRMKKLKKLRKY